LNLPDNIETLKLIIVKQNEEIQYLKQRIKELEALIHSNSKNSSKPPSTDGLKKQSVLPKIKHDKHGGQKGHKGNTLKIIACPDEVKTIELTTCPDCGMNLSGIEKKESEKRQVFDLPEPKLFITEYRNQKCTCPNCQTVKYSSFPEFVKAPVQYGKGVKAYAVLLNVVYKIPVMKISRLFGDLFKYPINVSTIITASEDCYQKLESTEDNIRQQIAQSQTVHFDETGFRVNGKTHWLHVASTFMLTYLFVHIKRGKEALESAKSLISRCTGWAIHDCWSSYFNFTNVKHGICGAHLLRELQGLHENGSRWAKEFQTFLLEMYQFRKENPDKTLPEWTKRYDTLCSAAEQEEPPPIHTGKRGKPKNTKGRNLLNRLTNLKDAVLAFSNYREVSFTNNLAEPDIRPTKLKQKVSGCFRTFHGAEIYARVEGYVSTLRKNGISIFNELSLVFDGKNNKFNCLT